MSPFVRHMLMPGPRSILLAVGILLVAIMALYVPASLAFPHHVRVGTTSIYSDRPIPGVMAQRLARADALLASSPIDQPGLARTVVLTDGGWRWRAMAIGQSGAIALRRPFGTVLIFNTSDVLRDRVTNNVPIGGVRTLSGTIAHEMTHVLVARRYGEFAMMRMPAWKREGYADYVAGETSIGRDDERLVRVADPAAPVLAYYAARRRVAAELARNGHSVDQLFGD